MQIWKKPKNRAILALFAGKPCASIRNIFEAESGKAASNTGIKSSPTGVDLNAVIDEHRAHIEGNTFS
ncbi:hypothetical protein [Roseateles sp.]|uniref:hypothetical protein n=1 Tax=Roseateles sp. TaxID=1971397 RepID=UPI003BA469DE